VRSTSSGELEGEHRLGRASLEKLSDGVIASTNTSCVDAIVDVSGAHTMPP